ENVEGWPLYCALQGTQDSLGIACGREEGASRGDMYIARLRGSDGKREDGGFGRIMKLGPGGDAGEKSPSSFEFRAGSAALGTEMYEHPQIGVVLGGRPQVGFLLFKGKLKTDLAYGGAIEGGYNASRFVSIGNEFWARIDTSFSVGSNGESF